MSLPKFMRMIGVMKVLSNGKMKMRLVHPITWILLLIAGLLGLCDIVMGREYLKTVWLEIKMAVVLI